MAASSIKFGDYDTGVVPALPVAAGDGQPFGLSATHRGTLGLLWGPYDDPAFASGVTPCAVLEQPVTGALHFQTVAPNPGSELQKINPATYTGTPTRPSGWWPVNPGESYALVMDMLGVTQADFILDVQGVFLEIDFLDASLAWLSGHFSPESPSDIHARDGTPVTGFNIAMLNPYRGFGVLDPGFASYTVGQVVADTVDRITAPAGAVWAVPYIGTYPGASLVEARADNAWFGRTDTAAFSATGLPAGLTIDAPTGAITGTVAEPSGHAGAATITLTTADGHAPQMIFGWEVA